MTLCFQASAPPRLRGERFDGILSQLLLAVSVTGERSCEEIPKRAKASRAETQRRRGCKENKPVICLKSLRLSGSARDCLFLHTFRRPWHSVKASGLRPRAGFWRPPLGSADFQPGPRSAPIINLERTCYRGSAPMINLEITRYRGSARHPSSSEAGSVFKNSPPDFRGAVGDGGGYRLRRATWRHDQHDASILSPPRHRLSAPRLFSTTPALGAPPLLI